MRALHNSSPLWRRHRHRDHEIPQSLAAGATMWPDPAAAAYSPVFPEEESRVKALLVVAHPDDESECAAFIYRITHELGGIVDQIVVTNGEGGHQYSGLAEAYYGVPLQPGTDGRKTLAKIRRKELIRAGRILGIRHNYFLDQRDTGPTLDPAEAFGGWDTARVKQELLALLNLEKYDLVLLLLPTSDTHGHHKTVAALALEVLSSLDPGERPAALGVQTVTAEAGSPESFSELDGYPVTRTVSPEPVWSFDRKTLLASHRAGDYSIVVNWVIAEHKSQGLFQMEYGRRTHETFWLFEASGRSGAARWKQFSQLIGQNSDQGGRQPVAREK
jgi:N-acetylglucosamine malate deacetylase 2